MSASGQARAWEGVAGSPFKQKVSPLRQVPGLQDVDAIKPDLMHVFNLGFGGDMASSTLVALTRLKLFDGRNIPERLGAAFLMFDDWCRQNHKTSSIKEFALKKFKMTSPLGCGQVFRPTIVVTVGGLLPLFRRPRMPCTQVFVFQRTIFVESRDPSPS